MWTFINVVSLSFHQIVIHPNDLFVIEFLNRYTAPSYNIVSMGTLDNNMIYDIDPGTHHIKKPCLLVLNVYH